MLPFIIITFSMVESPRPAHGGLPGQPYVPGYDVPLRTVMAYGEVEGGVGVQYRLETDMCQDKQQTGHKHRSDKVSRVTWKVKRREERRST